MSVCKLKIFFVYKQDERDRKAISIKKDGHIVRRSEEVAANFLGLAYQAWGLFQGEKKQGWKRSEDDLFIYFLVEVSREELRKKGELKI